MKRHIYIRPYHLLRAIIVESLDAEDWLGQTEFLKSCTGKTEDKLKAVNDLVEEGVIERRGQGVSGSKKEIRLAFVFPVPVIGGEQRIETEDEEQPTFEWRD